MCLEECFVFIVVVVLKSFLVMQDVSLPPKPKPGGELPLPPPGGGTGVTLVALHPEFAVVPSQVLMNIVSR